MGSLKYVLCEAREKMLNTLSTAAVLSLFYFSPLFGVLISIYFLFTPLSPLLLLYLLWIYVDRKTAHQDGRRSEWLRSLPMYQRFREYFPQRLIKTADMPPSKNYILCAFPHGILCTSVFSQFLSENIEFKKLFPGIEVTCHTLNLNFYFPFSREYVLSIGFCSVSKEALVHQLSKPGGRAVCLVVGGSAEAMISSPGTHRVIVKNRKGFIKLALTTGSDLVPIYSFGETDIYKHWIFPENSLVYKVQQLIRKFTGIAPIIVLGRGIFQNYFGFLPFPKPVNMVVGKPIHVEKVKNPTKEEINSLHERFVQDLITLFEEHKHKYVTNPEIAHLSIED